MIEIPWYELDRMIIMAFEDEWEPTPHVITRVMWQCIDRKLEMNEDEIVARLVQLVRLGTLALIGDIWHWRTCNSAVGVALRG